MSLKTLNDWMLTATKELEDIKTAAGSMLPEDRVARTMDLQEDIAAKLEILKANAATELELLPQGEIMKKSWVSSKNTIYRRQGAPRCSGLQRRAEQDHQVYR